MTTAAAAVDPGAAPQQGVREAAVRYIKNGPKVVLLHAKSKAPESKQTLTSNVMASEVATALRPDDNTAFLRGNPSAGMDVYFSVSIRCGVTSARAATHRT